MNETPKGNYKYEEIKEIVNKIIIEIDNKLEIDKNITNELEETHLCPEKLNSLVIDLIMKIFLDEDTCHVKWCNYVKDTIKASIDSMLFCLGRQINWLHNDQIKELLLDNIRYQLYHEKNKYFILKCLIDKDLFTREEYQYIHW
jgi:phosphoglycerate-specific signal transduction histidine kinase